MQLQDIVEAVVNIDIGPKDLQQCADAIMRLRAEYLFSQDPSKIHFHLTTGYDARFSDFVAGRTFRVRGEVVEAVSKPSESVTHAALGRYLIPVFTYAGTLSLSRELRPLPLEQVQAGDILVHGGTPGHAVLVVDMAYDPQRQQYYLLLAQSDMPAQDIHILRNTTEPWFGVWFALPDAQAEVLETPGWIFYRHELGRFE